MFESLQDGLKSAFKSLRGKGKLTEANMRDGLGLVEQSLLEADVSYSVVQDFMSNVSEQALGQKVLTALNPSEPPSPPPEGIRLRRVIRAPSSGWPTWRSS